MKVLLIAFRIPEILARFVFLQLVVWTCMLQEYLHVQSVHNGKGTPFLVFFDSSTSVSNPLKKRREEDGTWKEEVLFGGMVILGQTRSLPTPCFTLGDGYLWFSLRPS